MCSISRLYIQTTSLTRWKLIRKKNTNTTIKCKITTDKKTLKVKIAKLKINFVVTSLQNLIINKMLSYRRETALQRAL